MPEMTPMPHGFKAQAESISLEVREELGLTAHDRLDPLALAAHLAIPVRPITDLFAYGADAASLRCLQRDAAGFSAMTVFRGTRCAIFYNPMHRAGRRANSITHELAHVLLEHEPGAAVGPGRQRNWDALQEQEADWLAGTLLVPREGALRWLARGKGVGSGAHHFGVSVPLFRWRVNHTGVGRQLRHAGRPLRQAGRAA